MQPSCLEIPGCWGVATITAPAFFETVVRMPGAHLPENPMPRWIPMASVDTAAMFVAFVAWYRAQHAAGERLFYRMGMDTIMTQVDHHGAFGGPTDTEWVQDHYIPLRRVMCDGVLCKRCQRNYGGYIFRWYSTLWESLYMRYRSPDKQSWVPADGFLCGDPAEGAAYRGSVARDENGICLVPMDRWAPTAYVMQIRPPYVHPEDDSSDSGDSSA